MKIDSKKIASKYIDYLKRKEKSNEKPLSSGDWLWHVIDLLNVEELLREEDIKKITACEKVTNNDQ